MHQGWACPLWQTWKQLCLITIKHETFSPSRDLPSPSHLLWWERKLGFVGVNGICHFITLSLDNLRWMKDHIFNLSFLETSSITQRYLKRVSPQYIIKSIYFGVGSRGLSAKPLNLKITSKLSPSSTVDSSHSTNNHKMITQKMSLNKGSLKILTEKEMEVKGLFHCLCASSNWQSHTKHYVVDCINLGFILKRKWVRIGTVWTTVHNGFSLPDFFHLLNSRCHVPTLSTWSLNCQHLVTMVTMILTPPSPHIPLSLKPNYVELILPTCSLRTLLMVSGLLIGSLRCWKLLTGISKLQDMSDPWLFGTLATMSPSILSGSLIHDSLEINPPEPLTDALLGFHQHLDWCTKGQADEEKTKVNKIKMVSERLANSVWSPLENLPLFLPSSYRSLLATDFDYLYIANSFTAMESPEKQGINFVVDESQTPREVSGTKLVLNK